MKNKDLILYSNYFTIFYNLNKIQTKFTKPVNK